jgi:hypothetical protein
MASTLDTTLTTADLFTEFGQSLDDREAMLRAREQAVAERSSLLARRARELAHVEALVTAREEALREREARIDSVTRRLREDARRLELLFGRNAGARDVLARVAELDRIELELLARETDLDLREAAWWSKVTGREADGLDEEGA